MISSVSIYNKDGKLKKTLSAKTLLRRRWKEFYKREKTPKKFVIDRIKFNKQELLREYQKINNIFDELHCKEDDDG